MPVADPAVRATCAVLAQHAASLFDSRVIDLRVAEKAMRVAHAIEDHPDAPVDAEDAHLFLSSLLFVADTLPLGHQNRLFEALFLSEHLLHSPA